MGHGVCIYVCVLSLSLFGPHVCSITAQEEPIRRQRRDSLVTSPIVTSYLEMAGPAQSWLSAHVEYCAIRFRHEYLDNAISHSLRLSAGISVLPVDRYYLPLGLRYLMFESSSHLEVGVGASILLSEVNGSEGFKTRFPASPVLLTFNAGYRFEPQTGGVQLRIAYTPVYEFTTGTFYSGFGFSLGVAFF